MEQVGQGKQQLLMTSTFVVHLFNTPRPKNQKKKAEILLLYSSFQMNLSKGFSHAIPIHSKGTKNLVPTLNLDIQWYISNLKPSNNQLNSLKHVVKHIINKGFVLFDSFYMFYIGISQFKISKCCHELSLKSTPEGQPFTPQYTRKLPNQLINVE